MGRRKHASASDGNSSHNNVTSSSYATSVPAASGASQPTLLPATTPAAPQQSAGPSIATLINSTDRCFRVGQNYDQAGRLIIGNSQPISRDGFRTSTRDSGPIPRPGTAPPGSSGSRRHLQPVFESVEQVPEGTLPLISEEDQSSQQGGQASSESPPITLYRGHARYDNIASPVGGYENETPAAAADRQRMQRQHLASMGLTLATLELKHKQEDDGANTNPRGGSSPVPESEQES